MNTNLSSNRLTLNLASTKDLNFIHELESCPESAEFNTMGVPQDKEITLKKLNEWCEHHAKAVIERYHFKISLESHPVGLIGLNLKPKRYKSGEVWYTIHPNHWRKGIATEALNLVLDFALGELCLHRISAGCAVENRASIRILEKVGMVQEGRGRKILPLQSGWSDNFEFSILDSDPRIK